MPAPSTARPVRRLRWLAVLAALLLFAAACGADDVAGTADAAPAVDAEAGPVTAYNCGEQITLDAPAQRIVTYYQPTLEMIAALGATDRVVGSQGLEDDDIPQEWRAGIEAAPTQFDVNAVPAAEQVLDLEPDLVIVESEAFGLNAEQGVATRQQLRAVGADAFVLSYRCDTDPPADVVTGAFDDLTALGALLELEDRAEDLVAEYRQRLDDVTAALDGRDPVRIIWFDPVKPEVGGLGAYSMGARLDIVELAGAASVLPLGASEYVSDVSPEQIITADPDVILINAYDADAEFWLTPEEFIALLEEEYPTVAAVQAGAYATVTNAAVTSGPRMVFTIEELVRQFHPDALGDR